MGKEVFQEKRFDYKGYPCVVLFIPVGYRCGYVGLPKGTSVNVNTINCHGGITYAESHLHNQSDEDRFWIGFDCAHCFDGCDVEKAKEYFKDNASALNLIKNLEDTGYYACISDCEARSLEYCEEQCRNIVNQILEDNL